MKIGLVTVSPRGYSHAAAFDDLINSLADSGEALGHHVEVSTMPVFGATNIIIGAHLLDHVPWDPPSDSILYNLEQITHGSPWITPATMQRFRRFTVWDYSEANAAEYARIGLPPPKAILPVGWSPVMESEIIRRGAERGFEYDVLFYGSVNERRSRILATLSQMGLRVRHLFDVYGVDRDMVIARSRCVLNVHYYPSAIFEIVRVSYLLANRVPVVSEVSIGGEGFEEAVTFARYEDIPIAVARLLSDPDHMLIQRITGYEKIKSRPQAEYLRAALATL